MADYRRWYVQGGTYFFTVVAHERRPILETGSSRNYLRIALRHVRRKHPFRLIAIVVLPDHCHMVWELPLGDDQFSLRLSQFKEKFTRLFLAGGGEEGNLSGSRLRRRERGVWQRRFWEHVCRDEDDLCRIIDYIHWNPVKHGYVRHVREYRWSSFHRFVRLKHYPAEWGVEADLASIRGENWE